MIRKIEIGTNNPLLRQKAQEVKEITPQIKGLISDMVETLENKQGIGLAAPQVGQLLQIIIAKPELNKQALVLINPKIKKTSFRKTTIEEGCLSLPDFFISIKRSKKIIVEALDINGQPIKLKVKDLLARIIQHETDHLEGVLISDPGK